MEHSADGLEQLSVVRRCFESGKTRSLSWRKSQLKALQRLLVEREKDIFRVLKEDLGKHQAEAFRDEVGFLGKSVDYHIANLDKWVTPTKISIPLLGFPSTAQLVQEPLGVVLVLSTWNFPIALSLEPLIGAISAGNAVVIKPSELAPSSSAFLATNIPLFMDNEAVKVIQGGPDMGEKLLGHKWDKIFFTGSPRVGRVVMTAAAKHLTPVTLELGGKSPCIVDSISGSGDREVMVKRIIGGKWGSCNGQACLAIDYLLVEEKFTTTLVDLLKTTMKTLVSEPEHISKIVNKHHFERLCSLLDDPLVASSVVHGGSIDHEKMYIEPTILIDPPLNSEIMVREIFGPLLPIITLKKIEDSIDFIKGRPKPLVIYAFTNNEALKKKIVEETSSGGITFNDTLIQYVCDTIPFGGIGQSGFGKYHGKFSFDTFSHGKPVVRRSFLTEFSFRYPPWDEDKLQLLRYCYKFDYLRIILHYLGLKKY
ncbi:aldehyde dehydrogenase family 3 member F1-like [Iris pallida]|uniref:Aldehyde dehydrogenase n=1 Tax=Iris pallida TaxID=29817 RepID=A0AAX6FQ11_IRIPA|nr:aldehyde dehydrogenase family 3 member F1-like [Iris pallida]